MVIMAADETLYCQMHHVTTAVAVPYPTIIANHIMQILFVAFSMTSECVPAQLSILHPLVTLIGKAFTEIL